MSRTDLLEVSPDYAPARANLAILNRSIVLNPQVEPPSELSSPEAGGALAGGIRDPLRAPNGDSPEWLSKMGKP